MQRTSMSLSKAITAMAHTLAQLVYRMLKFGHHYVIRESNITKPNIDSKNYVGHLSRPQLSTCNSFDFQSLRSSFWRVARPSPRTSG